MRLSATRVGDVTVVTAVGDIDIATSEQLRECLDTVVDRNEHHIVLDLTPVLFVDSTFLGVLVRTRNRLQPVDGRISVVCRHPPVVKIFRTTGLDQVFTLHATLDDALHRSTHLASGDDPR
jgi:anti-sigma B factor antagonist